MARLMLIGEVADIELTTDDADGQVVARCQGHLKTLTTFGEPCDWTERYDDLGDAAASAYAAAHADTGC